MQMTVENVKAVFPMSEYGNVYMELYECEISPEDFVARFSDATLTHDSLYAHVNATTGWKNQFDAWKAEGIFN